MTARSRRPTTCASTAISSACSRWTSSASMSPSASVPPMSRVRSMDTCWPRRWCTEPIRCIPRAHAEPACRASGDATRDSLRRCDLRLDHHVEHVGDRRGIRRRGITLELLQPQHLALAGNELEAFDLLVQRLPLARRRLLDAVVAVADLAHLQALVVRDQRVVAGHALRRDLQEHGFAGSAEAGLGGGLADPGRTAAVG